MSPLRIETLRTTPDGIQIKTVQSADKTFILEPKGARELLGASQTVLNYHASNVPRKYSHGHRWANRVYDDQTLLRIAAETDKLEVRPHKKTGKTELVGTESRAL